MVLWPDTSAPGEGNACQKSDQNSAAKFEPGSSFSSPLRLFLLWSLKGCREETGDKLGSPSYNAWMIHGFVWPRAEELTDASSFCLAKVRPICWAGKEGGGRGPGI